MLDNAAGLLDQLGAAGTALAPHMLHAWKDAVTTRRTMLGLLDPSATDPLGHARAATATVADLEQLAERYRALYETAAPAALLTAVIAHVRLAQDALRQDPSHPRRPPNPDRSLISRVRALREMSAARSTSPNAITLARGCVSAMGALRVSPALRCQQQLPD
jgi:hypothetical protein